jgi:sulfur relay (sulfurtransferase) complex TusBCD TusD component (DsrE family)
VGEADAEADAAPGLFINLTTDDTWSAAMALSFAQQALDNDYEPVTVWLNVRAVYLADSNRPPHTHGMLDSNMHQMMRQFMQNGGRILACPTCTEAAGLTPDDYIDGVEMGEPSIVLPLLSDENTQTLAW